MRSAIFTLCVLAQPGGRGNARAVAAPGSGLLGDRPQPPLLRAPGHRADAELVLQAAELALARGAIGVGVARVARGFLGGLGAVEADADVAAEYVVAAHLDFRAGTLGKGIPDGAEPSDQLVERAAIPDFDKVFDQCTHYKTPPAI